MRSHPGKQRAVKEKKTLISKRELNKILTETRLCIRRFLSVALSEQHCK